MSSEVRLLQNEFSFFAVKLTNNNHHLEVLNPIHQYLDFLLPQTFFCTFAALVLVVSDDMDTTKSLVFLGSLATPFQERGRKTDELLCFIVIPENEVSK